MGRTYADKQGLVTELKESLVSTQMALIVDYQGLTVSEISSLRRQLRPSQTRCVVAKNTLMNIAVDGNQTWEPMTKFLAGTNAFLLVQGDVGAAVKAYQEFQRTSKKTELRGGVMDGQALTPDQIKAIGDLPSKEVLIAQVAGAINGVATKLAVGIKEVPNSLARAIKAVSEKEAA
ncbi:50S ribosomal protein L10 [Leptolyngbya sp. FACHB-261]|uniref:50S ribosomal protein L10 n=1 Tax=Leptolyngbya sp. FACHB-261 TaxID=2692806 RepID=UPI0016862199|nr:50S ribosomal protein L10 [Leptolyngbya sp. FACHB-261]MBD2101350.1 50S ribosomal protein L10 [Leptolyngbya sp. FACHB-261]